MENRKNILMFGGNSDERFVSVASAQNLARTMSENSKTPFAELWFISVDGRLTLVSLEELSRHENPFKTEFKPGGTSTDNSVHEAIKRLSGAHHVVFIGFHGTFGEDGKVQAMLEESSVPFTGSGSKSSHLCFEKTLTKKVVSEHKIKVAPEIILDSDDDAFETRLTAFLRTHGKIVVKPVANGSSIGLHIVKDETGFRKAIEEIRLAKPGRLMSEKFIEGRELTVGIVDMGSGNLKALPPSEVLLNAGATFDYDGKYLGRGTTEITPAKITGPECDLAQKTALEAHRSLGCFGYSRTDLILSDGEIYFIETNTLPGLTKASFIPQQLASAGITVAQFVEQQLANAVER